MASIIQRLKEKQRLHALILFGITTALCVMLVVLRMHFTSHITFVFLIWNIFLAVIPYSISTLLVLYHDKVKNRWLLMIPLVAWLSFFPNAPYILTDLFHLRQRPDVPFWYDLALVLFFAWNGLMLGYASVMDIQTIVTRHFSKLAGWGIALSSLILGSYGIYLGRYLRWNTWDIISSPTNLFLDIVNHFTHPFAHQRTFGVTIIFSLFLVLGYLLLLQIGTAFRPVEEKR
jgi:uncharacterized membrane protein